MKYLFYRATENAEEKGGCFDAEGAYHGPGWSEDDHHSSHISQNHIETKHKNNSEDQLANNMNPDLPNNCENKPTEDIIPELQNNTAPGILPDVCNSTQIVQSQVTKIQ